MPEAIDETPEQRYFSALELQFARLRGAAVLLSPGDWAVARTWWERGIPIDLVVRTMELLLARRAERDLATPASKSRRINSLRYFGPAVDAAWEELRALTAPGHVGVPAAIDVPARLAALAGQLPADLPRRAARARALAALAGAPPEVEDALAALDAELLAEALAGLSAEEAEQVDAALAARTRTLAERLPAEEVVRARAQLRERLVRQLRRLPVLSLFVDVHAEAPETLDAK